MKDFPSCFCENGVQVADSSSSSSSSARNAQNNMVTCVYQCWIRGRSCPITVNWSKKLVGQLLTVGIHDCQLITYGGRSHVARLMKDDRWWWLWIWENDWKKDGVDDEIWKSSRFPSFFFNYLFFFIYLIL